MDEDARAAQDEARRRAAETKKRQSKERFQQALVSLSSEPSRPRATVTINQICEKAGLSTTTFLKYFASVSSVEDEVIESLAQKYVPVSYIRLLGKPKEEIESSLRMQLIAVSTLLYGYPGVFYDERNIRKLLLEAQIRPSWIEGLRVSKVLGDTVRSVDVAYWLGAAPVAYAWALAMEISTPLTFEVEALLPHWLRVPSPDANLVETAKSNFIEQVCWCLQEIGEP